MQALKGKASVPVALPEPLISVVIAAYNREHIAKLALRIAEAGRTFVEANHSYRHRAEQIAGLLAEPWPAIPSSILASSVTAPVSLLRAPV